jgi:hypothetical protein
MGNKNCLIDKVLLYNIRRKELQEVMTKIDEFTIQKTFVEWARKQEFILLCFAVPNGFQSNRHNAIMMKREGLLAGVPDVFCLLNNGKWAIIEFKTETGVVGPHQKAVIEKLQEGKQNVKVCRSTREAVLFVKEVLNV